MVFLMTFTSVIVYNIILMSWPEVMVMGACIFAVDLVFMIWPHGLFRQSVALIGLDFEYAVISIAICHMTIIVLGTWIVEVKRRTERQLRFINENLNKLVEQKVAEVRKADREVRQAQEQLDKILRHTPVGVVICDEKLNCLYSNGVHFKFEIKDGTFCEIPGSLLPMSLMHNILKTVYEKSEMGQDQHLIGQRLDFLDANQCERMLRYSYVPVMVNGEDGEEPFKRLILITEDITIEEVMRYKLVQADHLSAMGKMAAGLAHEINNPLSVIRIYVEALGRGINEAEKREKIWRFRHSSEPRIQGRGPRNGIGSPSGNAPCS
jgi:signal transduction histidine kinase